MPFLISGLGLVSMMVLAWLLSSHRRLFPWRVVVGGLALQFAFASFILRTDMGRTLFVTLGDAFQAVVACADHGADFLFDFTAEETALNPAASADQSGVRRMHVVASVAFRVLPTIVFFSALMSMLYYMGIMQRIVEVCAWVMQRTLGTFWRGEPFSGRKHFRGTNRSAPGGASYVASMTVSELNSVMVGGFATIAGGVLAAYTQMGIDAGHLMTASVISAPAALLIAKIMVPESEQPQTRGVVRVRVDSTAENLIQAAADGAADGMKLALNVAAMLIAFLALVALINLLLSWLSVQLGLASPQMPWRLEMFLGWLFYPFAWLMGIPTEECRAAGEILGMKTVTNEFLAYQQLAQWDADNKLSPRTVMILTYALCGFANLGSIGIQIGGIGSLAESRRGDLARLGLRAMVGGTLACFMTACVAGIVAPQPGSDRVPLQREAVGQQLRQGDQTRSQLGMIHIDQPNRQRGANSAKHWRHAPHGVTPPTLLTTNPSQCV